MATFKQFGGLGYSGKNNIMNSTYGGNAQHRVTGSLGDVNTRVVTHSHIDLSGNSILRVDGIYFLDGTVQRTASGIGGTFTPVTTDVVATTSTPSWGTSGTSAYGLPGERGPTGARGLTGPPGPAGPAGSNGSSTSLLSDIKHNTFAGTHSLLANGDNGKYNSAFGERTLFKNVSGYANSAVGYETMVNNTTGAYNTAVGLQALSFNVAGTRNTCLGAAADVTHAAIHNSTAIGAGARVSSSNVIQLGNTNVTDVITSGIITGKAKNFTIEHPLEKMRETHVLKHASIEAPRLDLIYRDTVPLCDGRAQINIDTHFRMSEGTFCALSTHPSTFVSNESDWDPVKASMQGNILHITCKNPDSVARVAFMVVSERRDEGIVESHITDDDGRFVPECPRTIKN